MCSPFVRQGLIDKPVRQLTDTNIDYVVPVGLCYLVWYFFDKMISNAVSNVPDNI